MDLGYIRKVAEQARDTNQCSSTVSASVPASGFSSTLGAETDRSLELMEPAGSDSELQVQ